MKLPDETFDARIGCRLRALREERRFTLDQLAAAAGVSRSMLSRVERAESSATAQLLNRICGPLGISLSVLFAEAEEAPSPLARREAQPVWQDPDTGYRRRAVSPPGIASPVDLVEVEFPPFSSVAFENRRTPGFEQYVWVLDGLLELTAGEHCVRLHTGDCFWTPLDRVTEFRNPAAKTVRYLVVLCRIGTGA